jgi:hypothetical protein
MHTRKSGAGPTCGWFSIDRGTTLFPWKPFVTDVALPL